MSKKSTKSVKPAAPQVKPVKQVVAAAKPVKQGVATAKPVEAKLAKKTAAPKKIASPPKPVVVPLSPKVAAAGAAVRAALAPASVAITAQIDIGFGNSLFIRGEGAGLSWDSGLLLECEADDRWSVKLSPAMGVVTFKLLVNDLTWSTGENYMAAPGGSVVVVPVF